MNERLPHAILDQRSRQYKARKIELEVGESRIASSRRLLEVGTGSGLIAAYLREHYPDCRVSTTDVVDSRTTSEDIDFHLVSDSRLPFEDAIFDVVITNHVIEHVGDAAEQRAHLRDIRRVLKDDGVVYFAVPNRWSPMENHYRLPLLSWPWKDMRDRYVRFARKGTHYDCEPLGPFELRRLFDETGFSHEDRSFSAIRRVLQIEHAESRLIRALVPMLRPLMLAYPVFPTYVFMLRKAAQ